MSCIGPLNILGSTLGPVIVTRLEVIPGAWLHSPCGLCLSVVCMSESSARSRGQCTIANSSLTPRKRRGLALRVTAREIPCGCRMTRIVWTVGRARTSSRLGSLSMRARQRGHNLGANNRHRRQERPTPYQLATVATVECLFSPTQSFYL